MTSSAAVSARVTDVGTVDVRVAAAAGAPRAFVVVVAVTGTFPELLFAVAEEAATPAAPAPTTPTASAAAIVLRMRVVVWNTMVVLLAWWVVSLIEAVTTVTCLDEWTMSAR